MAALLAGVLVLLGALLGFGLAARGVPRARMELAERPAIPSVPESPAPAAPAPSVPPPLDGGASDAVADGGPLEDAKSANQAPELADQMAATEAPGAASAETESYEATEQAQAEPSDQSGAATTCGVITCGAGQVCCNPSCGICTDPGASCSKVICGMPPVAASVVCGPNTCNVGQICCNPSCGVCISPGQSCDLTPCDNPPEIPFSVTCGLSTCNVGYVCCNASCGICALPGETCDDRVC